MPQRIFNLSKWKLLPEGQGLFFDNQKVRNVAVDVNCPHEVAFYVLEQLADREYDPERLDDLEAGRDVGPIVVDAAPLTRRQGDSPSGKKAAAEAPVSDGRAVTFLGLAKGRDRFEFGVSGAFELVVVGGPAYVYTVDSADLATRVVAPVIFTRIANRRQRNPQLEMMEYQMRLNQNRMYAELEQESARRMQAMEKRLESYATERHQGTPLAPARAVEPAQGGGGTPPDAPAGKDGADESESGAGKPAAKGGKAPAVADHKGPLI